MRNKYLGPLVPGLLALTLVVVSAFVPWFEWSVQDGSRIQVSETTVWGPRGFVSGSPQYGTVEIPGSDERVVDLAALAYLVVLLLSLASLLPVPFRALSAHWGRRKAALAVALGGLTAYVSLALAVGCAGFIISRAMRHGALQSTWVLTFQLQRVLIGGPLLLLAGAVAGIGRGIGAFCRCGA